MMSYPHPRSLSPLLSLHHTWERAVRAGQPCQHLEQRRPCRRPPKLREAKRQPHPGRTHRGPPVLGRSPNQSLPSVDWWPPWETLVGGPCE